MIGTEHSSGNAFSKRCLLLKNSLLFVLLIISLRSFSKIGPSTNKSPEQKNYLKRTWSGMNGAGGLWGPQSTESWKTFTWESHRDRKWLCKERRDLIEEKSNIRRLKHQWFCWVILGKDGNAFGNILLCLSLDIMVNCSSVKTVSMGVRNEVCSSYSWMEDKSENRESWNWFIFSGTYQGSCSWLASQRVGNSVSSWDFGDFF